MIIKWLAIVGGAVLLIVLLVNSRDQELTPEARALAEYHPPSVPDRQNAYLALVGFDAPAGIDPIATGARIVGENNVAAASDPSGHERMLKRFGQNSTAPAEGQLKFVGNLDVLPEPLEGPCLPQALEHASDIRAMIGANAELVARYLAMQRLPDFANTSLPDMLLSTWPSSAWIGPRRLLLMRSALDAQTGQAAAALGYLEADMAMWRRILGRGDLLSEMIAARVLAADFKLLSELIAAPAFDVRANATELRQMLVPLSQAELNMAPLFKREFEMEARFISALPDEVAKDKTAGWIDHLTNGVLFYKPNATLNLSAQLYAGLQTLGSHPPAEFIRLRDKVLGEAKAMGEPGVTWIYNPMGRMNVGIVIPAYPEYVARVFDLAAYANLVRAQLELRLASVPLDKAPEFLTTMEPEGQNPYTEQSFRWNAADNSFSFDPMSNRWREWSTKIVMPPPLVGK